MKKEKPKPCPFCGKAAFIFKAADYQVGCCDPGCCVCPYATGYHTKEEAIKAWNTRSHTEMPTYESVLREKARRAKK